MCSVAKTLSSLLTLFIIICIIYVYWEDIVPLVRKICKGLYSLYHKAKEEHGLRQ